MPELALPGSEVAQTSQDTADLAAVEIADINGQVFDLAIAEGTERLVGIDSERSRTGTVPWLQAGP